MDIVLIELVLWAGLVFFLWVLKDSLGNIESELDRATTRAAGAGPPRRQGASRPERLFEAIGSYGETTIFRYAVIDGMTYEFDYVSSQGPETSLAPHQRYIAPGLVYSATSPVSPEP